MRNPAPETIREARQKAGLTQAEAAALVHAHPRSWQKWENGERKMPEGTFELFCLKAGL